MLPLTTLLFSFLVITSTVVSAGPPYTIPYDNDFIDPAYFFSHNLSISTTGSQRTAVEWADYLNTLGPWSVMNKTVTPPSGSKHDYLSWAPYYWPNCTGVGNTTVLPPEQVWARCRYYYRDGQFNPDRLLVNDTGRFGAMADAVFYNSIAWVLTGTPSYASKAAGYINTWFLDPSSSMTPNLRYAQMHRGRNGQVGTHTGLLDLKCMTKVATGILILRRGSSAAWTNDLNTKMVNWTTHYINWMLTSPISIAEYEFPNNHGTYFYNQLAANQIIVGNITGAAASIRRYFSRQYLAQIDATGEQPEEANRTHPYHYRAYNLAAMIVNARLGDYLGLNFWSTPTTKGGTIQKACDFAMNFTPDATEGNGRITELYSSIAAIASKLGDPSGKYAAFLASADPNYPAQPYFLWNQPFSDSGLPAATAGGPLATPTHTKSSASKLLGGNVVRCILAILLCFVHGVLVF